MVKRAGNAGRWWTGQGTGKQLAVAAVLLCPLVAGSGQVAPASQAGSPPPSFGAGQAGSTAQPSSSRPPFGTDPLGSSDPLAVPDPRRLEHVREEERHKRLQADMTKLVQLTNELKEEVDKTSKDELSVDVVRKAAEIEKLAHDVKERMKG